MRIVAFVVVLSVVGFAMISNVVIMAAVAKRSNNGIGDRIGAFLLNLAVLVSVIYLYNTSPGE